MHVVVCVKPIPPGAPSRRLDPASLTLDRTAPLVMDDVDAQGVELALRLAERASGRHGHCRVTAVSMAPEGALACLRGALAMGVGAGVVVSDDALAGSDSLVTAKVLAAVARRLAPDLIVAGTESSDGYTGTMPAQLAELLGLPSVTFVRALEVRDGVLVAERQGADRVDEVTCPLPALVTAMPGVRQPRYPSFSGLRASRSAPIEVLSLAELGLAAAQVGPAGSRQRVVAVRAAPARPPGVQVLDGGDGHVRIIEELVRSGAVGVSPSRGNSGPNRAAASSGVDLGPTVGPGEAGRGFSRIWVVTEPVEGRPGVADLDLLDWARGAAQVVEAVHWGPDARAAAPALGAHGARRVLSVGDLGDALPGAAVAAALAARVAAGPVPDAVLFSPSHDQRDIAGRLSARLDRPLLANAVGLTVCAGGDLVCDHDRSGGRERVSAVTSAGPPSLVLVRPRSLPVTPGPAERPGPPAEVVALPVLAEAGAWVAAAQVVRRARAVDGSVTRLDDAAVVVAGGRGVGSADQFGLVAELAALLGGAPAATRAVVDAGWAPFPLLVGQSGRTVAPEVYLAFGISGADQHVAGMAGARTIVAVNTDADAPIMALAHLAVVGDAPDILRRLVAHVAAIRASRPR